MLILPVGLYAVVPFSGDICLHLLYYFLLLVSAFNGMARVNEPVGVISILSEHLTLSYVFDAFERYS